MSSVSVCSWRPSPILNLSLALHVGAVVSMLCFSAWWIETGLILLLNHGILALAGLLPRSKLLGRNLNSLPVAAVRRGEVALTIDDGPDPQITPLVLDILDAYEVRATFFCIGERACRNPQIVQEIVRRGHAVENHSQSHDKYFALCGPGKMRKEILAAQNCLSELTGRVPKFFRPVAGLRNPFLDVVLAQLGLRLASWSRRAYDTRCRCPRKAHRRLTQGLVAGDILLLHDGNSAVSLSGKPLIVELLPMVLESIKSAGLKPVTLDQAVETTCT